MIGRQERVHRWRPDAFRSEIAPARTFAFADSVEDLRSRGQTPGGSLKNAVVVGADRVWNEEGLRFPDEFVRHQLLDGVGDLSLAGATLQGHYIGRRPNHELNVRLIRTLLADQANWRLVAGQLPDVDRLMTVSAVAHG